MTLKSAYDNLRQRTMEKIPGILEKLRYVAGLRSGRGNYEHWGFERQYGSAATQTAFAEVHKTQLQKVLQTRLSALKQDLERSGEANGTSPLSYVSQLSKDLNQLLPSGCPKEAESHLASVLQTLSALEHREDE